MHEITSNGHQQAARRFKQVYSTYRQNQDLISVGAYHPGSHPRIDEAIRLQPKLLEFLQQDMGNPLDMANSLEQLLQLMAPEEAKELTIADGEVSPA